MSNFSRTHNGQSADSLLTKQLDFLAKLPGEDLRYILEMSTEIGSFRPREVIYRQDDPVDYVYYIIDGEVEQVRTEQGDQQRRQSLRRRVGKAHLLGHFDLLYNQVHSTTARATSFVQIVRVQAQALNRLIYRFPEIRNQFAPLERVSRLRTVPFFAECDLIGLSFLAEAAGPAQEFGRTRKERYILRDATSSNFLYVIDRGQVVLEQDGRETWLGTGAVFGYADGASGGRSSVDFASPLSVRAVCPTRIFCLPRREVTNITNINLEKRGAELRHKILRTLSELIVFSELSETQLRRLSGFVSFFYVPVHHLVVPQGQVADSLWVLMENSRATLHAVDDERALPRTPIAGPSYFSEAALLDLSRPMASSVEAEPDSYWLRLHTDDFRRFLGRDTDKLRDQLVMKEETLRMVQDQEESGQSWLESGERMSLIQRRHWIVFVRKIWFPALLLLIITVGGGVLLAGNVPGPLVVMPAALLWLVVLAYLVWSAVDYYNDFLLVTSLRIVRQERVVFFSEWQQVAPLEQVQSVDTSRSFVGNLLGFGDVRIQTASQQGSITFDFVPEPEAVRSAIFEQIERRQTVVRAQSKMLIHEMLETRLGLTLKIPGQLCMGSGKPEPEPEPEEEEGSLRSRVRDALDIERHMVLASDADHIVWRKHWFLLLQQVFAPLALTTLLVLGVLLLPFFFDDLASAIAVELPAVLFALMGLAWVAWIVADWRNDTYEITDSMIIDVQKRPLFFSEERREARLIDIEDILLNIPSPLHYLLDFGNVTLQTAAAEGSLTFDAVPHPRQVTEEIRRRISAFYEQEERERQRQRNSEMPDWFEMYDRMDNGAENRVNRGLVKG